LAAEFYKIIESESNSVEFLQTHGLPDDTNSLNYTKCDGVTKIRFKEETFSNWRSLRIHYSKVCKKGCQTFQSTRKKNAFLPLWI